MVSKKSDQFLNVAEALSSSLDLSSALRRAGPALVELTSGDHIALAVSRPGTLYDYEWHNNSLPPALLGEYEKIAEQDFVRKAVAAAPNTVLREHQMLPRKRMERHLVYQRARDVGAPIERIMAVMLWQDSEWSSGLSIYRERERPFTDQEARDLQRVVPLLKQTVSNCRSHGMLERDSWMSALVDHLDLAVVQVRPDGRELGRTQGATRVLESFFSRHERPWGRLPEPLQDHLAQALAAGPTEPVPTWVDCRGPRKLTATFVRLPDRERWAVVLKAHGLDSRFEAELDGLPARLRAVALAVLEGLTNVQIAARDDRSLATIKQQVSQVYRRFGVAGRVEFLRLASDRGWSPEDSPN